MIDTHCHLTHAKFADDEAAVIARAQAVGLSACISIGTGVDDARAVLALIGRHPGWVYGTAGIDPFSAHRCGTGFDDALCELSEIIADGHYCAVGEIGLDYHYDLDPRPVQRRRFVQQLTLAADADLPVVIHVREAHDDMIDVLSAHPDNRGVIHSFTAGPAEAEAYIGLGWYLAFNGVLTFNNADEVREAARLAPANRLLIETDSPYLAPVPKRGRRCEPAFVAHTLTALATTRDETPDDVERVTTRNAQRLFGLNGGLDGD